MQLASTSLFCSPVLIMPFVTNRRLRDKSFEMKACPVFFHAHITSTAEHPRTTHRYRVAQSCTMDSKEYPSSLTSRSTSFVPSDEHSDSRIILNEKDLPPVDGGPQAWLFLIASAMLEALVWGARPSMFFGVD
jgi:hypothetical protein